MPRLQSSRGIDYSRLGIKHKLMMRLLHSKAAHLPEEKKAEGAGVLIDAYNSSIASMDFEKLGKVRAAIGQ